MNDTEPGDVRDGARHFLGRHTTRIRTLQLERTERPVVDKAAVMVEGVEAYTVVTANQPVASDSPL